MRLYHVPGTRSTRVLWALEEIGAPYELTVMAREDRQTDEHRRSHSREHRCSSQLEDLGQPLAPFGVAAANVPEAPHGRAQP